MGTGSIDCYKRRRAFSMALRWMRRALRGAPCYNRFSGAGSKRRSARRETTWMWMISFIEKLAFIFLVSHDIEILITLPDGKGCIRSQQLMAEDLGQEDVVGLVSGFKLVASRWRRRPSGGSRVSRVCPESRKRRKCI